MKVYFYMKSHTINLFNKIKTKQIKNNEKKVLFTSDIKSCGGKKYNLAFNSELYNKKKI